MTDTPETEQATGSQGEAPRGNIVRRLYDWVLHWADTPYGVPALFLISFAESSFFPLPPDPLLLALCLGAQGALAGEDNELANQAAVSTCERSSLSARR